jgi:quercetin dioxygenase-like cupin family protein
VTGHDENGAAELVSVGDVPRKEFLPNSKNEINFCWGTAQTPLLPHGGADPTSSMASFLPPPGGTTFLLLRFAPDFESAVHATDTIDYCTVISGEIWLVLEDGTEERMRPGDCVVQNGTHHAWHNRGAETCVMSTVMVGAKRA